MRKGVYYISTANRIVYLFNVEIYEIGYDPKTNLIDDTEICICSWEDDKGVFHKVRLDEVQFKLFKRIGDL